MEKMKKAKKMVDGVWIRAKLWTADRMERFLKEERGDTNFVAIIVIIVIILAIAGIFRSKLQEAVEAVFEQLLAFVNGGES